MRLIVKYQRLIFLSYALFMVYAAGHSSIPLMAFVEIASGGVALISSILIDVAKRKTENKKLNGSQLNSQPPLLPPR